MSPMTAAVCLAGLVLSAGALLRQRPPARVETATSPVRPRRRAVPSIVRPPRPRRGCVVAAPRAVADWCDALARTIRSGSTVGAALGTVVPADAATVQAIAPVQLAIDRGRPVGEALTLAVRAGPHLHLALTVLGTVVRLGGPATQAIDAVAATLRQRADDGDARAVQTAQARLSAHVMTALPLLMLGLFVTGDPDVRATTTTPVGALCLVLGAGLNAGGWWWMRRIVTGPW